MCSDALRIHRGFSMLGLLITMVCIVVLFALLMNSLNLATSGGGTQQAGTVRSHQDRMYLYSLYQSMAANAAENNNAYIRPSQVARGDVSLDTTANLFSVMVIQNYTIPKQLISGNEYSGYVEEMLDYDYNAHNPAAGRYWDTRFQADLHRLSNVSFAHMPLIGQRLERKWRMSLDGNFPLLGNRGPQDGINSSASRACGRDGIWRGHYVFGDGRIDFYDTPLPAGVFYERNGERLPDNVFMMETGPQGGDAILSFTRSIGRSEVDLQFD